MTDFKAIAASLEERGFCVVPEFLSRDEIDFLVAESADAGNRSFLSPGSRSVFRDRVQSDASQLLDSVGQAVPHRGRTARHSLGSAAREVAARVQPLPALGREQAVLAA